MNKIKEKLDIVIPIYNEEACLEELFDRLIKLRENLELETSFIFINDGSKDSSLAILAKHSETCDFIKIINLSRNFGHQYAITAGLDYSEADFVAIIDADLQDPPELIESMYKKMSDGIDIVYGKRIKRKGEGFFKRISASLFYRLLSKLVDVNIPKDTGDFRFINKKVLNYLKLIREKHRFIRGLIPWIGFKSVALEYERDKRYAGKTKYTLSKMIKFSFDAIFSFSNVPLRIVIHLGFFIFLLGCTGVLLMVYFFFFTAFTVPGITATICTIIIMSGMQIIMLGVIGEYIGRIFEETKKRPLYIVDSTKNI